MDRLDVEVEPLDSLFGIDETRLPCAPDELHEAAAGIRMAWAAAANPRPALDLLRARRRHATKSQFSRAAILAGAAAGLSVGWSVERHLPPPAPAHHQAELASPTRSTATHAAAPVAGQATAAQDNNTSRMPTLLESRVITAPSAPLVAAMIPLPLPLLLAPQAIPEPLRPELSEPPALPPRTAEVARPWENVPPLTAPPRVVTVSTAGHSAPIQPAPRPKPDHVETQAVNTRPAPASRPVASAPARQAMEAAALPFDATLETILYGPDRSLAIVNGRIVGVGDDVRGARVVEITASAVLLRDAQGRLRRLSLAAQR
jgi:hypothetical protein